MQRGLLVAIVSLVFGAGAALAAPAQIPLRGTLTDSAGTPVDGTVTVTFSLYGGEAGGTPFHTETQELTIDVGDLDTALGVGAPLDLGQIAARDDVWLGIKVGNDEELGPRLKLGTVPYAATAAQVPFSAITGLPPLQSRVTGVCAAGTAVSGVGEDGTVTCVPVGTGGGTIDQLAFAGSGISIQVDTIGVIFGDHSDTATEGNDIRLLGYPDIEGGVPYTFEGQWQTLPPGVQGDFLRGRAPEEGPPYWGPILAEEVPPGSNYYIQNRDMTMGRQTASVFINGFISTSSAVSAGGDVSAGGALRGDVVAPSLQVGLGTPFHKIAYGEEEVGSESGCDNVTIGFHIPDVDFTFNETIPLATCVFSVEFDLGVEFSSTPMVFLTPRSSGGGDYTWAMTYHPVGNDRIRVTYWRADKPGNDWDTNLVIQWLAFN